MRLITYRTRRSTDGTKRLGRLIGDEVVDLHSLLPEDVDDMLGLIRTCNPGTLQELGRASLELPRVPLADVELLAPIPRPAKNIFCVGKNYHEHAEEFHRSGYDASASASAAAVPEFPIIFSKPPTSVIGPDVDIPGHLDPTGSVDYENELAVIIGKPGRGIAREDAYAHVFGYTIVNDVTSRNLQQRHKQWLLGKGIDGFCPMGPAIVTADEIGDIPEITLTTRVNGEVRQHAKVRDLIFDIPTLIASISASITLEPGDIIATGTPAGVGIGFTPPRFLVKGDVVEATIDPIGTLRNAVG